MSMDSALMAMSLSHFTLAVIFSAAAYFFGFELNEFLFDNLVFSHAVNWIFLPSGLEIFAVLLALDAGALGIALGSIAIGFIKYYQGDVVLTLLAGFVTGLSPWIARKVCIEKLDMHPELLDLTPRDLLKISIVFAITSAFLHQILYFWFDRTENFIFSTGVMAMGNWLGTSLILTMLLITIQVIQKLRLQTDKKE